MLVCRLSSGWYIWVCFGDVGNWFESIPSASCRGERYTVLVLLRARDHLGPEPCCAKRACRKFSKTVSNSGNSGIRDHEAGGHVPSPFAFHGLNAEAKLVPSPFQARLVFWMPSSKGFSSRPRPVPGQVPSPFQASFSGGQVPSPYRTPADGNSKARGSSGAMTEVSRMHFSGVGGLRCRIYLYRGPFATGPHWYRVCVISYHG